MRVSLLMLFPLWCFAQDSIPASVPASVPASASAPLSVPVLVEPTRLVVPMKRPWKAGVLAAGGALGGFSLGVASVFAGAFTSDVPGGLVLAGVLVTAGAVGLAVGPSLGHLYIGKKKHARITAAARFTLVTLGTIGFVAGRGGSVSAVSILGGVYSTLGLALYDCVAAPIEARRLNKKLALQHQTGAHKSGASEAKAP